MSVFSTSTDTTIDNPIVDLQTPHLETIYNEAEYLYDEGAPEFYPFDTVASLNPALVTGISQGTAAGALQDKYAKEQADYYRGILSGNSPALQQAAQTAAGATAGSFGAAGTLGSSRNALASNVASQQAIHGLQQNAAKGLNDAVSNASTGAGTTIKAGALKQTHDQSVIDADREAYEYDANLPWTHLNQYQSTVTNPNPGGYGTGGTKTANPSLFNTVTGAIAAGSSFFKNRGGRVGYNNGGMVGYNDGGELPEWEAPVFSHEFQMIDGVPTLVPTTGYEGNQRRTPRKIRRGYVPPQRESSGSTSGEAECLAQGGAWDPVRKVCILPKGDSEPVKPHEYDAPYDEVHELPGQAGQRWNPDIDYTNSFLASNGQYVGTLPDGTRSASDFPIGSSEQATDFATGYALPDNSNDYLMNEHGSIVNIGYDVGEVDPALAKASGYTQPATADMALKNGQYGAALQLGATPKQIEEAGGPSIHWFTNALATVVDIVVPAAIVKLFNDGKSLGDVIKNDAQRNAVLNKMTEDIEASWEGKVKPTVGEGPQGQGSPAAQPIPTPTSVIDGETYPNTGPAGDISHIKDPAKHQQPGFQLSAQDHLKNGDYVEALRAGATPEQIEAAGGPSAKQLTKDVANSLGLTQPENVKQVQDNLSGRAFAEAIKNPKTRTRVLNELNEIYGPGTEAPALTTPTTSIEQQKIDDRNFIDPTYIPAVQEVEIPEPETQPQNTFSPPIVEDTSTSKGEQATLIAPETTSTPTPAPAVEDTSTSKGEQVTLIAPDPAPVTTSGSSGSSDNGSPFDKNGDGIVEAYEITGGPAPTPTPAGVTEDPHTKNMGGWINRNQGGGIDPNHGTHPYDREGEEHDTIPIMATPDEYILDSDTAHALNKKFPGLLDALNEWEPDQGERKLHDILSGSREKEKAEGFDWGDPLTWINKKNKREAA